MLIATIKCSCGSHYDIFSNQEHSHIKCPNCQQPFIESEKLIDILKTYDSMNLKRTDSDEYSFDKVFNSQDLKLMTVFDVDNPTRKF